MNTPLIEQAEKHCADKGQRLTAPRREVLAIIARSPRPVGAYEIIESMPAGTNPPTVYRALEFWESEGFVHRIGSLGVYTTCHAGHRHDGSQFMVCDGCGRVEEIHLCALPAPLRDIAGKSGFSLSRWNLELHGSCRSCTP